MSPNLVPSLGNGLEDNSHEQYGFRMRLAAHFDDQSLIALRTKLLLA